MDLAILEAMNGWSADPGIAAVAMFLSSPWPLVVAASWIALRGLRGRRYAVLLSIALSLGASDRIAAGILKPAVGRVRPCRAGLAPVQPVPCGVGESFPSAHAANAFALLVAAAPLVSPWILGPAAVLVSLSRIVLGVHYPSDVLGGAVFGAVLGIGGLVLGRRWEARLKRPKKPLHRPDSSPSAPDPPAP
ncbi:MAG: phosphatase PAP2 family protein [Myxococcota bacterium]